MSERPRRGILSRLPWAIAYLATFSVVFAISAGVGLLTMGGIGGALTLQSEGDNSDVLETAERTIIDVPYVTQNGVIEERPVVLYQPDDGGEQTPLVFVPHYEIEQTAGELGDYLREGWSVASPTEVATAENGALTDDDLVFNNAALHTLRNLPEIDPQRIAVVGGSAGGYTALMLNALQLGTTATVASAPITNAYFNFHQYFDAVETATRDGLDKQQLEQLDGFRDENGVVDNPIGMMLWARWNGLPFPLLSTVSGSFAPISQNIPAEASAERWEAFSPTALADAITSPVVINHNTADILVPLDQVTKRYSYDEMGATMPDGFTNLLGADSPGVLSDSLEEQLDPMATTVTYTDLRDHPAEVTMPADLDALVNINVYDDGPPERNGSHGAVDNTTRISHIDYLREQFNRGLAATEQLTEAKLLLLIERHQGDSIQLPAHLDAPDTVYGSLAMYQQEISETLTTWTVDHSADELQAVADAALNTLNGDEHKTAAATWATITEKLTR